MGEATLERMLTVVLVINCLTYSSARTLAIREMLILPSDGGIDWTEEEAELDEPMDRSPECVGIKKIGYKPVLSSNRNGTRMEIRQDTHIQQLFNIEECAESGQRCSLVDDGEYQKTCATRVSWTLAMVRQKGSDGPWNFDYIFLPGGCQCTNAFRRTNEDGADSDWSFK